MVDYGIQIVLATDDDFDGNVVESAIGSADYVIIPEKIKGITVTRTNDFASGKGLFTEN